MVHSLEVGFFSCFVAILASRSQRKRKRKKRRRRKWSRKKKTTASNRQQQKRGETMLLYIVILLCGCFFFRVDESRRFVPILSIVLPTPISPVERHFASQR